MSCDVPGTCISLAQGPGQTGCSTSTAETAFGLFEIEDWKPFSVLSDNAGLTSITAFIAALAAHSEIRFRDSVGRAYNLAVR